MAQINTRIILRKDTAANWSALSTVLAAGEYGFDTTNKYIKVGDGTTEWNKLGTIRLHSSAIDELPDGENTIYDLSVNADNTIMQLLSADGTAAEKTWSVVKTFTPKGWQSEIDTAVANLCTDLSTTIDNDFVKFTDVKSTVSEYNKIVTENEIKGITGAMHFKGVATNDALSTGSKVIPHPPYNAELSSDVPVDGDVVIDNTATEFVWATEQWNKIGDETLYAKKSDFDLEVSRALCAEHALSTDYNQKFGQEVIDRNNAISDLSAELTGYFSAEVAAETDRAMLAEEALLTAITEVGDDLEDLKSDAVLSVMLNGQVFTKSNNIASLSIEFINCGGAEG